MRDPKVSVAPQGVWGASGGGCGSPMGVRGSGSLDRDMYRQTESQANMHIHIGTQNIHFLSCCRIWMAQDPVHKAKHKSTIP